MDKRHLKRDHERFICDRLLEILQLDFKFVRMGNDRDEPDVIYCIGNRHIGIELGTAYYDNSDAKQEWTLARGERQPTTGGIEERDAGIIISPDNLICRQIQQELNDKCEKRYVGTDESWLCIEQRAPLSDAQSTAECIEQLRIPPSGFAKTFIFYLAPDHDGGGYRAVCIYSHA